MTVPDCVDDRVPDCVDDRVPDCVDDRMPDGVDDRVPDCVDDRVPECVDDRVPDGVDDRVRDCVDDRVPDGVDDRVPDGVDDRVPDCVDERVPDASLDLLQVELSKHGLYSMGCSDLYQLALSGIGVNVMSVLLADTAALLFLIRHPKPKFITQQYTWKRSNRIADLSKFVFATYVISKCVFWAVLAYLTLTHSIATKLSH